MKLEGNIGSFLRSDFMQIKPVVGCRSTDNNAHKIVPGMIPAFNTNRCSNYKGIIFPALEILLMPYYLVIAKWLKAKRFMFAMIVLVAIHADAKTTGRMVRFPGREALLVRRNTEILHHP